jgi:hypothetical protein
MRPDEAIRRTLAEICHLTDARDFGGWVDLFIPDGQFVMFGEVHRGRAALRAFIEADQIPANHGWHMTCDAIIDVDGSTATASSHFVFFGPSASGPVVVAVGAYHDILVYDGSRWRFSQREATLFGPPRLDGWETSTTMTNGHDHG